MSLALIRLSGAELQAHVIPEKRLVLRFEQVDSQELKGAAVVFEGDRAICKVGDGEASHYHIPNDKKLWETQFMVCSIGGEYFLRDLGFFHATRMKLDNRSEVQLNKGCLVDIGKVVHYHIDKVTHAKKPTEKESDAFFALRHGQEHQVAREDLPRLRARPTWVSSEENVMKI